jgi:hypothetical protein
MTVAAGLGRAVAGLAEKPSAEASPFLGSCLAQIK